MTALFFWFVHGLSESLRISISDRGAATLKGLGELGEGPKRLHGGLGFGVGKIYLGLRGRLATASC